MSASAAKSNEHLPFRTKLLYGLGDWGNTTTTTIFQFFFAIFLTDTARLDPLFVAPVLLIGGVWDAINDPLVGVLADRVRTRWGRRRPFFLFGAIPFGVFFAALWWVPPVESQLLKAVYYTLAYMLWDTFFTLLVVPYGALTPELTEDYDERTRLTGYRMAVSMAGGLIAAIAAPSIYGAFSSGALTPALELEGRRSGFFLMAIIFGALAIVPYFMLFFNMKERFSGAPPTDLNLLNAFRHTWNNRPFRYAAGIYLTAWVTVALVTSLFTYYITYWMRLPGELEVFLGLVQASALISIPVIVFLSGKLGKQKAYIFGLTWWMVVMAVLAFLPSDSQTFAYFLAAIAGMGVAAAHVIPWSIVPDVIEADELATGERREGAYYGFLVFIQKTGSAFTLAIMALVLKSTGYVPDQPQNEPTLLAIRLMIGLVPAVLLTISMVLAWKFPLGKQKHAELRAALAEKRAEGK